MIIRRAYADWSEQRRRQDQLVDLAIEPVHNYRSNKSGKNSSDIVLAIDAIDLLHGAPIDTFVIVSSDSDFVPLVRKLRGAGKAVIGSGRREVTSSTLVKSCDRYIYLNEQKPATGRQRRSGSNGSDSNSLVVRAMEASMGEQGQVVGSKLHNTMQRIDPSFSFKSLGFTTFRQFLSSCKEVTYTQPKDASDVVVQLKYMRERGLGESNGEPAARNQGRNESRSRFNRRDRVPSSTAQRAGEPKIQGNVQTEATQSLEYEMNASSADEHDITNQSEGDQTSWDVQVDKAWSRRGQNQLSGRVAAGDAAKVLNAPRLSASDYPTLDKLLEASGLLSSHWSRQGNAVLKK